MAIIPDYKNMPIASLCSTENKILYFVNQYPGLFILAAIMIFITACRREIVPEPFLPRYEHEAYQYSIEQANLASTALGQSWKKAGKKALYNPVDIILPFQEEFYLDPAEAEAVGYRFFVLRGLRVEIEISVHSADTMRLFADLFRQSGDSTIELTHVASADKDSLMLKFEPRRDSFYVLRLQPELLRGGRFRVLVREVPTIGFPVTGKNSKAILSFFGDPRDAGTRAHHGVDIFAARHTPVVAPSDAEVTRIGEGDVGGKYIWLHDQERTINMYFAHLQSQEVTPGTSVVTGQIIGTVGNSGNARFTPPHLHFGIYSRGPVDPYHFIAETNTVPSGIFGDTLFLGKIVRSEKTIYIKTSPGSGNMVVDTFAQHTIMKITGLTGNLYHVLLPDGLSGYIAVDQVEMATTALDEKILSETTSLLDTPGINAVCMNYINQGEKFEVFGKYGKYSYGKTIKGRAGWITVL